MGEQVMGTSRAADDLKSKLLKAKMDLYNLRSVETTVHPFLVTEYSIIRAGIRVKRVRLAGPERERV